GLDATNKWPAETTRTWSRPIRLDPGVEQRVDALWGKVVAAEAAPTKQPRSPLKERLQPRPRDASMPCLRPLRIVEQLRVLRQRFLHRHQLGFGEFSCARRIGAEDELGQQSVQGGIRLRF